MYATTVIEQAVARYEQAAGHKLIRIAPARCEEWIAHLDARLLKHNGDQAELNKNLTKEEKLFIRNERVMSMLDFSYWSERYATIQKDGGGVCKFIPWESQKIILRLMAKVEQEMYERVSRREPVDGLLIVGHKARQLGETCLGRTVTVHRMTTQQHRRAMAASVDEDKIQELYDRDKLLVDNLPWWLKPEIGYDEKRSHLYFEKLDSRVIYQVSSQKSGLGVGRQFDLAHLTELSTWVNAPSVELDFFPTLPQSITTFALLESTAYGRGGWWHDFTERVRKGASARWFYSFIPYYAEPLKYRRLPPDGWVPSEVALKHAEKVHETSPEFMGRSVLLSRETLYWWESTRSEYQKGNNLAFFLTNYAATPEESFQHSGQSAFSPELLEELRLYAHAGTSFELVR